MPIVLRNSKNSALTHSELDGNFTDLDTRVNSKADSSTITSIVNAEYIQARQINLQRDSAFITNIVSETYVTNFIDSAYIQVKQNTYDNADVNIHLNIGNAAPNQILSWTGADYDWINQTSGTGGGIDSAVVVDIVDSAYVQARQQTTTVSLGLNDLTDVNTLDYTSPPDRSGQPLVWDNVDSVWYPGNGLSLTGILHMEDNSFINLRENAYLHFEGSVTDGFDTILNVINPTANRTVRLPDASGTVALTSDIPVAYTNADVDTHLNVSTATSGQVLSWNGTDYAWVTDQTGGGGGGLDSAGVASYLDGGWNFDIIPDTNAAYDIGSAEYKVRHFYLSNNSMKFVDDADPQNLVEYSLGVTNDYRLQFDGSSIKNTSTSDVTNGATIDITKTNHFVNNGETAILPNGTYQGQKLDFWRSAGAGHIDINVNSAIYIDAGSQAQGPAPIIWRLGDGNKGLYSCIWNGVAWILSEGGPAV